jgi:hypothetical protein
MQRKLTLLLLVLIVILPGTATTSAQDTGDHPLLRMLALIPDVPSVRENNGIPVAYLDRRAIETHRAGAAQPQSWAEWRALSDARDPSFALWMAAFDSVAAGPDWIGQILLNGAENMVDAVGFDYFDITRALSYGQPPAVTDILEGDFDISAVGIALSNREFTETDRNGIALWCGLAGCENGLDIDFAAINMANPFGGRLGRTQPLVVLPGYLVSSPVYDRIEDTFNVLTGAQSSLADAPDFRAAADAIIRTGTLLQALFLDPNTAFDSPPPDNADPLLVYSLAAVAQVVNDPDELTLIALVFDDVSQAQAAAGLVEQRLSAYESLVDGRLFTEVLEERGLVSRDVAVYFSEAAGKSVLIITFRKSLPTDGLQQDESGLERYEPSGLIFRTLVNALYQRDLNWLAPAAGLE